MSEDVLPTSGEWWRNLSGSSRFKMMKKYDVEMITEKAIRRMYRKEFEI